MHRLIREHARRTFGEQYSIAQTEEAREAIEEKIKSSLDYKKMASRKLGASLLHTDSESVLRNDDPLAKARQPVDSLAQQPLEDLPEGWMTSCRLSMPLTWALLGGEHYEYTPGCPEAVSQGRAG